MLSPILLMQRRTSKQVTLVLLKRQSKYSSVQKAELKTIYTVLLDIKKPVNIVLDSQYAVKVTSLIETVTIPNSNLPIIQLLISYKMLFFIKIVLFILLIFDHFHNFQDL